MFDILCMNSIKTSQYFICKLTNSRFIYDSDNFQLIIVLLFIIVTFNDVKQDIVMSNVSFKDSIKKIIIDAAIICKDVVYQSAGPQFNIKMSSYQYK